MNDGHFLVICIRALAVSFQFGACQLRSCRVRRSAMDATKLVSQPNNVITQRSTSFNQEKPHTSRQDFHCHIRTLPLSPIGFLLSSVGVLQSVFNLYILSESVCALRAAVAILRVRIC